MEAKLSDLRFNCFKCKKAKARIYQGLNKQGAAIQVDETGLRWMGYTCGECHREACRLAHKAKYIPKVRVLLEKICPFCTVLFTTVSEQQITCSASCRNRYAWQKIKNNRAKNK